MDIKIKRLIKSAVIPKYAHETDAGLDLYAIDYEIDQYDNIVYHTGIAIEIPEGYMGLIFPRSSNAKTEAYLTNSVGVIDSGYRGEITLKFKTRDKGMDVIPYFIMDRIGQLIIMPYPKINFIEVNELSDSERGIGGYGSTGK